MRSVFYIQSVFGQAPEGWAKQMKTLREEQTEATRDALVAAARVLFGDRGYVATSTEEIVRRARVTRGALYHHFAGKADLFRAVFEAVDRDVVARVIAARADDPWKRLLAGCMAFLDACLDPAVQRIYLLDAPAVLGWDAWRELEARSCTALLRRALGSAIEAGAMRPRPIEPLAQVIFGALMEAAIVVARAEDVAARRAEVGESVAALLGGLRSS